jgi:hypothetical protein
VSISSFMPTFGPVGAKVTINGSGLSNAQTVFFGSAPAQFTVLSANQITATVPAAATSGPIQIVVTPSNVAFSASSFSVVSVAPIPTISSLSPTSGPPGSSVVITGTNFTAATLVQFGGGFIPFTINSDTQITATVPASVQFGSLSSTIQVFTAPTVFAVTPAFTITVRQPVITSFSPSSGPVNTPVTIQGTLDAVNVSFNNFGAFPVQVVNPTTIIAVVPLGATTGVIKVSNAAGATTSSGMFTVTAGTAPPTIFSFFPDIGGPGTSVFIDGVFPGSVTAVSFNGVAAPFQFCATCNSTPSLITATVPPGGTTGPITVITSSGMAQSQNSFTVH